MRLNKFLAHAGVASRRKVDKLIEEGMISVNNKKAVLGQKIDPAKDAIRVNNQKVQSEDKLEYFILNKPKGVTSTVYDKNAKQTVVELVRSHSRIYPVGRLDKDSTGLILLTNDGDLANRLTHPRYQIPKAYEVTYLGKVKDDKINLMEKGIELEEGKTEQAKIKVLSSNEHKTVIEVTLFEGRKRQIRRMAEKLHLHILTLKRTTIGPIKLADLKPGEFRKLTPAEVLNLKRSDLNISR